MFLFPPCEPSTILLTSLSSSRYFMAFLFQQPALPPGVIVDNSLKNALVHCFVFSRVYLVVQRRPLLPTTLITRCRNLPLTTKEATHHHQGVTHHKETTHHQEATHHQEVTHNKGATHHQGATLHHKVDIHHHKVIRKAINTQTSLVKLWCKYRFIVYYIDVF